MDIREGTVLDDGREMAALIWETDPEMCEFVFGSRATWLSCGTSEWGESFGLHSHLSALVAVENGRTLGLLIAYPESEMAERYAATVARYESAIAQRMETVGWLFPLLPPKSLYLFNLAVAPEHRGRGIGRRLLAEAEDRAVRTGLTSVQLDVAATVPAVKFYGGQGYAAVTKTELLEPRTAIPPHLRMLKSLSSQR